MSAAGSLAGLQVMVVRPPRHDDVFVTALKAEGATIEYLPVMAIEPLDEALCQRAMTPFGSADKVVVVSSNAAQRAIEVLGRDTVASGGPSWFAVGRGSAEALLDLGVTVTYPRSDATSEGLLALPELAAVAGQRVLIVRGEGGRDVLRAELVARGATVHFGELYRRVVDITHRQRIQTLLAAAEVNLLVAHSVEVLANLLTVVGVEHRPQLAKVAVLVPSDRAAELAREAAFGEVLRAASALPAAMVAAINGWYTAKR